MSARIPDGIRGVGLAIEKGRAGGSAGLARRVTRRRTEAFRRLGKVAFPSRKPATERLPPRRRDDHADDECRDRHGALRTVSGDGVRRDVFRRRHAPAALRDAARPARHARGGTELERRHKVADLTMRQQGITFTVYGREQGVERIIPFDPIPRLVAAAEWDRIERGLKQRVRALNLFIHDVYHDRQILKDRVVPPELVFGASGYRRECVGLQVPEGHLHPRLGHRPDPRRRRPLPRAGGQLPDPLGRQLRAQEPPGDEAGLPVPVRAVQRAAGRGLHRQPAGGAPARSRRPAATTRPSSS